MLQNGRAVDLRGSLVVGGVNCLRSFGTLWISSELAAYYTLTGISYSIEGRVYQQHRFFYYYQSSPVVNVKKVEGFDLLLAH